MNIDFEDEQDMVEKMRVGLGLQPLATALFSNSPFRGGEDTGLSLLKKGKDLQLSILQSVKRLCERHVGIPTPQADS